jgi:myosin heavy subunit
VDTISVDQVTKLIRQNEMLQAEKSALQQENNTITEELNLLKSTNTRLELDLDHLRKDVESQVLHAQNDVKEEMYHKLAVLQEEIIVLEQERDSLRRQYQQTTNDLEDALERIKTLSSTLDETQIQAINWEEKCHEQNQQMQQLRDNHAQILHQVRSDLEHQLSTLRVESQRIVERQRMEYESLIERETKDFERRIESLIKDYEQRIELLGTDYDKRVDRLNQDYRQSTEQLVTKYSNEIKESHQKLEETTHFYKQQLEHVEQLWAQRLTKAQDDVQHETKVVADTKSELERIRTELTERYIGYKQESDEKLTSVKKDLEDKILATEQQRDEYQQKSELSKAEVDRLNAEIKKLTEETKKEVETLTESTNSEKIVMEERIQTLIHENQNQALQLDILRDMDEKQEQKMIAIQEEHISALKKIEKQMQTLVTSVSKGSATQEFQALHTVFVDELSRFKKILNMTSANVSASGSLPRSPSSVRNSPLQRSPVRTPTQRTPTRTVGQGLFVELPQNKTSGSVLSGPQRTFIDSPTALRSPAHVRLLRDSYTAPRSPAPRTTQDSSTAPRTPVIHSHTIGVGSTPTHHSQHTIGVGSTPTHQQHMGSSPMHFQQSHIGIGSSPMHQQHIGVGSTPTHFSQHTIAVGNSPMHQHMIGVGNSPMHQQHMRVGSSPTHQQHMGVGNTPTHFSHNHIGVGNTPSNGFRTESPIQTFNEEVAGSSVGENEEQQYADYNELEAEVITLRQYVADLENEIADLNETNRSILPKLMFTQTRHVGTSPIPFSPTASDSPRNVSIIDKSVSANISKLQTPKTQTPKQSTPKPELVLNLTPTSTRKTKESSLVRKLDKFIKLIGQALSVPRHAPDNQPIATTVKELKPLVKSLVKQYTQIRLENENIKSELGRVGEVSISEKLRMNTSELDVSKREKRYKDMIYDLKDSILNVPSVSDILPRIRDQEATVDKLAKFAKRVQDISNGEIKSAKLGYLQWRDEVIDLDHLQARLAEQIERDYKTFCDRVIREVNTYEESQDVDKLYLGIKIAAQTINNVKTLIPTEVENRAEALDFCYTVLDVTKGDLEALKKVLNERCLNWKLLEREHRLCEIMTSQLRQILRIDKDDDIVASCEKSVHQLRRYVDAFPKFQRVISILCRELHVDKIEQLVPAVEHLMRLSRSVDRWIRDNTSEKDADDIAAGDADIYA